MKIRLAQIDPSAGRGAIVELDDLAPDKAEPTGEPTTARELERLAKLRSSLAYRLYMRDHGDRVRSAYPNV